MTRIVRKTTTLTRGEERCVAEDLTKRATAGYLQDTAASSSSSFSLSRQASPKPKTVRVSAILAMLLRRRDTDVLPFRLTHRQKSVLGSSFSPQVRASQRSSRYTEARLLLV